MGDYDIFAKPSFIEGMARVLDLGGTLNDYNYSCSGDIADIHAVESDWITVGEDLRGPVKTVKGHDNK